MGVFKEIKKESPYNDYKKSNEKKFETLQEHHDARADSIANCGPRI